MVFTLKSIFTAINEKIELCLIIAFTINDGWWRRQLENSNININLLSQFSMYSNKIKITKKNRKMWMFDNDDFT